MFSSGSQLLCLQHKTRAGRERGGRSSPPPPLPAQHRGVHPRTNGPLAPSAGPRGDRGIPAPGPVPPRVPAGRAGGGRSGRRRPRRRGASEPRASRGSSGCSGGRGAGARPPGGRGCRGGEGGGSGAPRGGGEGRAAAALICKQKERRDPNKSGRAGGRHPRPAPPRPAPRRPAHLEDQPRHLTRYSSLPCGERRGEAR